MNKIKKSAKSSLQMTLNLFSALFLLFITTSALAEDSYSNYDDIVKELSTSSVYQTSTVAPDQDLIRFHSSFGMLTNYISMSLPDTLPNNASLTGYEFRLGIDLFSKNWISYGTFRSYDPERFGNGQIELKEFDLIVAYNNSIRGPFRYTVGGGMASRYLDFKGTFAESFNRKNSTPASVVLLGLEAKISRPLSAGVNLTYRSALISETVDNGGWDGNIHLSAQF